MTPVGVHELTTSKQKKGKTPTRSEGDGVLIIFVLWTQCLDITHHLQTKKGKTPTRSKGGGVLINNIRVVGG